LVLLGFFNSNPTGVANIDTLENGGPLLGPPGIF
jgi:hypothetical protein